MDPTLAEIVAEEDFVPEVDYDRLLRDIPGADNVEPVAEGRTALNDLAVNRQRCVILGDAFLTFRRDRAAARVALKRSITDDKENSESHIKKKPVNRKCSNISVHSESQNKVKCKVKR